jgi:hypothetical protein
MRFLQSNKKHKQQKSIKLLPPTAKPITEENSTEKPNIEELQ